jgi:hypothetical protein
MCQGEDRFYASTRPFGTVRGKECFRQIVSVPTFGSALAVPLLMGILELAVKDRRSLGGAGSGTENRLTGFPR